MSDEPDWRTEAEIERDERRARRVPIPRQRLDRIRQYHHVDRLRSQGSSVVCVCGASRELPKAVGLNTQRNELVYWFEMHLLDVGRERRARGLAR